MAEATEVAVVGGGAIGGWLAAGLAAAGHDVTLCVRTPVDRLVVDEEPVVLRRITADPASVGAVPWVLVATKAQDAASTEPWLAKLLGEDSTVVVVQNGIDHEDRVAAPTVLPALAYVAAERVEPGRIRQHTPGWLEVPDTALGRRFAELADGVRVDLVADFRTSAWRKLYANAAANPLSALTLSRMGQLREGDLRELAARVLRETVEISMADGASVDPDVEVGKILDRWPHMDPGGGTSMLYDRVAGRPMEHEYITGAVVRYADKHGHPAPLNRLLLTLLRALNENR